MFCAPLQGSSPPLPTGRRARSLSTALMLGLVQYSDSEDEREEPQPAGNRQQQGRAAAPAAAAHQHQAAAPPAPASGLPSAADLLGGGAPQVRLPPPDFGQGRAAVGARQQMGPAAAAAGAKRGHPDTRGPLPNPMALDAKVPRRSVADVCDGTHAASVWAAHGMHWLATGVQQPAPSVTPCSPPCCSGGAQNVGGAKPSTAAGGLLLPPQLRQAAASCPALRAGKGCGRCTLVSMAAQQSSLPQLPLAVTGMTFPLASTPCRGRANVATEDLSTMFTKQAVQRAQQRRSSSGSSGGSGGS